MTTPGSRGLLHIYLTDHLAAAAGGVALARRVARSHRDTADAERLKRLADDIAADRGALLSILRSLGMPPRRYKSVAVWAAEKGGRLKLNGRLISRSPLSDLVEVEALRLAVEGKAAGWRTLLTVADHEPELDAGRLRALLERATAQIALLDELHTKAAGQAFHEPQRTHPTPAHSR
ncbi:hypothetical protein [Actinomadura bangladeshensis]|uniref:Uncharacterized protein n=1 Tax=Actinomadura bangladeshensis TaxID=453573 RepID=A0A4R4ND44_9ACTN|nr:hypothetical protein [Actinomadura bangladeshensis]TDC05330.1 hypothetical protein E1284_35595 [Actinomadura bangladeshensis]